MIILILILLGLCFGSFVNALVWRVYKQEGAKTAKQRAKYSIANGRSMCTHCRHVLDVKDLIPIFSWVILGGKCRYCHKPIQDTPWPELVLPLLFVASYLLWPQQLHGEQTMLFCFWLVFLVGFLALATYDLRWFMLPNRIVFPLMGVLVVQVLAQVIFFTPPLREIVSGVLGVVLGGGFFWLLFQVSNGKWIGGGDVKLGFLLGGLLAGPLEAAVMIFFASLIGCTAAVPFFLTGGLKRSSRVPFGPCLLLATVIVRLFGAGLITWYKRQIGL